MTRFTRLSPLAFALVLAACAQAQPLVEAPAALPANEVVVSAGSAGRLSARLALSAPTSYGLMAEAPTVHRWVAADVVRYDVELKARNAQGGFDGLNVTAPVPVNAGGAGVANFTNLTAGNYYRAFVKAMGRRGGATGTGDPVQLNTAATADHADFDFTATNDVAAQVQRSVSVTFDGVAFSGSGAISFGTPSPGSFTAPATGPAVTVSAPPVADPIASYNLDTVLSDVGLTSTGDVWVTTSTGLAKYNSTGSLLGTNTGALLALGNDKLWGGSGTTGLVTLNATNALTGGALGTTALVLIATNLGAYTSNAQGHFWYNTTGIIANLYKVTESGGGVTSINTSDVPASTRIAADASGNLWSTHANDTVSKRNESLVLQGNYSVPGVGTLRDVAAASDGSVWVASEGGADGAILTKLSAAGAVLSSVVVGGHAPTDVEVDANNNAWVVMQAEGKVVRVSSAGAVLNTFTLAAGISRLAVQSNVAWVIGSPKLYRITLP